MKNLKLLIIFLGLVSFNSYSQESAASGPTISVDGEQVPIEFEHHDLETLRQNSPRAMRAQLAQEKMNPCSGVIKSINKNFISEKIMFDFAVGLSAKQMFSDDPAMIYHFAQHSLVDPSAYASFYAFMVGNHGAIAAVQWMGLAAGGGACAQSKAAERATELLQQRAVRPLTLAEELEFKNSALLAQKSSEMTNVQKNFRHFVGPIGMGVGMIFSTSFSEFLADADLRLCAKGYGSISKTQATLEACDRAYENWVISKKIMDYAPDLISTTLTVGLQGMAKWLAGKAIATGTAAKIARGASLVFNGMRMSWVAGSSFGGWAMKIITTASNLVFFLDVNDGISPWIKWPFEKYTQGNRLMSEIGTLEKELKRTEDNKWVYVPPPRDPLCDDPKGQAEFLKNMQAPGIDSIGSIEAEQTLRYACTEEPGLKTLIRRYGEQRRTWRRVLLQDAFEAHSNWTDYLTQYISRYADSYNFYSAIAGAVSTHNVEGYAGAVVPPLYLGTRAAGLDAYKYHPEVVEGNFPVLAQTQEGAIVDVNRNENVVVAYTQATKLSEDMAVHPDKYGIRKDPNLQDKLYTIMKGMAALNPDVPFMPTKLYEYGLRSTEGITTDELEMMVGVYDFNAREKRYKEGLDNLNEILKNDLTYNDQQITLDDSAYAHFAKRNPFMRLRLLLGDTQPTDPGVAFIESLEKKPDVILQDTKDQYPFRPYPFLTTSAMSEYLLATMVCGPNGEPTVAQTYQMYQEQNASLFDSVLTAIHLKSPVQRPKLSDLEHMDPVAQNEFLKQLANAADRAKYPTPSWFSIPGLLPESGNSDALIGNKTDVSLNLLHWKQWATFRPPRLVDIPVDVCNKMPNVRKKGQKDYNVYEGVYKIGNEEFHGFLDLIRRFIRPDVVRQKESDSPTKFVDWWKANVDPTVQSALDEFHKEFVKIIEQKFVPQMTNQKYCRPSGSDWLLLKNLPTLVGMNCNYDSNSNDATGLQNKHQFALGVGNSFFDEAKYYLTLLAKLHFTNNPDTAPEWKDLNFTQVPKFRDSGREFLSRLRLMTDLFSSKEKMRAAVLKAEELGKKFKSDADKKAEERANMLLNGHDDPEPMASSQAPTGVKKTALKKVTVQNRTPVKSAKKARKEILPLPPIPPVYHPLEIVPPDAEPANQVKQAPVTPVAAPTGAEEIDTYWHPRVQNAYRILIRLLTEQLADLKKQTDQPPPGKDPGDMTLRKELNDAVFTNLKALVDEINSLYGVVNTVEIEELTSHTKAAGQ